MRHGNLDGRLAIAAAVSALFAVACADPGTSPRMGNTIPSSATLSFVNTSSADLLHGEVDLCKQVTTGSTAQEFPFSYSTDGGSVTQTTQSQDDGCVQIFHDETAGVQHTTTITEGTLPANWTLDSIRVELGSACTTKTGESDVIPTAVVITGNDCGRRVIFFNHFTQPGSCTFTKGYYRNHPDAVVALISTTISVGGANLSAAQAQAILDATPGKPGSITFTSNDLLNLVQQLITAILNGGLSGPQSVQDAIAAANAGITITAFTAITTTLTQTEIGDLIGDLSDFNEGFLAGFPHCGD